MPAGICTFVCADGDATGEAGEVDKLRRPKSEKMSAELGNLRRPTGRSQISA